MDETERFNRLMADATGVLEGAATLAADLQAAPLSRHSHNQAQKVARLAQKAAAMAHEAARLAAPENRD